MPPGAVDAAARLTGALPQRFQVRNPSTKVTKLGQVLAAAGPEEAYLALVSHWQTPESLVLGAPPGASLAGDPGSWPALGSVTEQMLWLDLVSYLPDDILTKLDRAAMAVLARDPGAVPRPPGARPRLAPSGVGEDPRRRHQVDPAPGPASRTSPPRWSSAPKMGFGLPLGPWLRGPLRPWAEELLSEQRLRRDEVLDPAPVRRAWGDHLAGRRDFAYELWDVLALQSWLDRWGAA